MCCDRLRSEEGAALIGVLLALVVISGIAVLAMSRASSELRYTADNRDYEHAVHAAEGGAEMLINRLNADRTYNTGHVLPASFASPAAERAWAVTQYNNALANPGAATSETLETTSGGRWFGLRPMTSAGEPAMVVYSVGQIGGTGAEQLRVVRLDLNRGTWAPPVALLTGCDLDVGGNPSISGAGAAAGIHSNCDLQIWGSPTVTGAATSTGAYSQSGGSVGPGSGGGKPAHEVPDIDVRSLYDYRSDYDGSGAATYDGTWFDLCPDGTVRRPAGPGGGPCTSSSVLSAGGTYRGWRLIGNNWDLPGNTAYPGVYYVYEKNVSMSGSPGSSASPVSMTVLAQAGSTPNSGNFFLSGNPTLVPHMLGLLMLADRDMTITGTPSMRYTGGLLGAGEQITITGNPSIKGAIVAEHGSTVSNINGSGADANTSFVSGNFSLQYDGSLLLPLANRFRIAAWTEL